MGKRIDQEAEEPIVRRVPKKEFAPILEKIREEGMGSGLRHFVSIAEQISAKEIRSEEHVPAPRDPEDWSASTVMMWSDLHRSLEMAFGKCDGMAPGKYKKARIFAFETENFRIVAVTETGDRGSGWYFGRRGKELAALDKRTSPEDREELRRGLREILRRIDEADPELRAELSAAAPNFADHLRAETRAKNEAKEMAERVPEPRARKSPGRM